MRVLVTRPQPSAARTATRLEAMGHVPVLLPMARAVHYPEAGLDALAKPGAAIAVTSAEALRSIEGKDLADHFSTPVYCVGEATADAAGAMGFRNVIVAGGTGASLASLILASKPDGAIIYLAGTPRSPEFEAMLAEADAKVRTAEVYAMEPIIYQPAEIERLLGQTTPDAALFYSRETARIFFAINHPDGPAFRNMRVLCMSARVAEAVPSSFPVSVAQRPDENSLLSLL